MKKTDEEALSPIVEQLERHRQAATYGAVAGVIGGVARFLMSNRPRDHRHSWVVSKETQRPTGYRPSEMHPALIRSVEEKGVIEMPEELKAWLKRHP
jgi:hypothetical protein